MNKKVINISIVTIAIVAIFIGLKATGIKVVIPESESVNGTLFLLQDKNITNDYVVFEYNKIDYKNYHNGKLFIKKIGCDSGQHLLVQEYKVVCDGRIIAAKFIKNREGQVLPNYRYDGIIPNNEFFALGEHIQSFDSRYFGLVDKKQIINSARRIF
jgi:type IV secretory pathway protease TraF